MRCIFVLDLFNGAVVHAVRGERRLYEPIDRYSKIVSSSDPMDVLHEIGPREIYVADLNLLAGSGDNLGAIARLSRTTKTMADIGISSMADMERLPERIAPILGTETASLRLIEDAALERKIVVSIDMLGRKVLTKDLELEIPPLEILRNLNGYPIGGVILLELDKVGTSSGLDVEFLEKAASISDHPLILGGGVKGTKDLETLKSLGFQGALVATAVHSGSIPLETVRQIAG